MKKLFVLSLALVLVTLLVSSCNSTKPTNAVETSQETTVAIEETTETVVETTVETSLNYYKLEATVTETTETKETAAKKKTTTTTTSTTTETAVAIIVVNNRQVTGDGGRLSFQTGDNICGAAVEINGKTFPNCVIKNAPMGGVVISGVIWPWDSETIGLTLVSNDEILAPVAEPTATASTPTETTVIAVETTTSVPTETTATTIAKVRTPTGVGQSLTFEVGDTIVGWSAVVNGQPYEGENGIVIYNSPYSGVVTDGVVNPWPSEITNQTVITP